MKNYLNTIISLIDKGVLNIKSIQYFENQVNDVWLLIRHGIQVNEHLISLREKIWHGLK